MVNTLSLHETQCKQKHSFTACIMFNILAKSYIFEENSKIPRQIFMNKKSEETYLFLIGNWKEFPGMGRGGEIS